MESYGPFLFFYLLRDIFFSMFLLNQPCFFFFFLPTSGGSWVTAIFCYKSFVFYMSSIFMPDEPIFVFRLELPHFNRLLECYFFFPDYDVSSKLLDLELFPDPSFLVNLSQFTFWIRLSVRDYMSYLFSGMVGDFVKRPIFTKFFISSFLYFLLSLSQISSTSKLYMSVTSSDSKRPFYISTRIPTRCYRDSIIKKYINVFIIITKKKSI